VRAARIVQTCAEITADGLAPRDDGGRGNDFRHRPLLVIGFIVEWQTPAAFFIGPGWAISALYLAIIGSSLTFFALYWYVCY